MTESVQIKRLLIIGAGELGRQVLHFVALQGQYECVGFLDDTKSKGAKIDGIQVRGCIGDIYRLYADNVFDYAFIAIGYNHFSFKERIYNSLKAFGSIPLATIVAPMAWIDPTARIGEGCIIYPGAIIDKEVSVSDNVVVNVGAKICHNTHIGLHCYISPNATISGFCNIGKRCMLGVSTTIKDNISICDDVMTGASALITKPVIQPGIYINVNERMIK